MSERVAHRFMATLLLLWVVVNAVGMTFGWIDVTGPRLIFLAVVAVAATGWLVAYCRDQRADNDGPELCTGGDLCPCYTCTVSALHAEDRAWLEGHGWTGVIRRPVGPKRATWQTEFDRVMAREADSLRTRVANATAVRTGASPRGEWDHSVFGNGRSGKAKYLR